MSCSPFDLRDYYFKELAENERRLTEVHVKTCAHCREELDRLRGTETALLALPDEEIPQRIGFVSDPVFQPSGFRRGWDALWGSAAMQTSADRLVTVACAPVSETVSLLPSRPSKTTVSLRETATLRKTSVWLVTVDPVYVGTSAAIRYVPRGMASAEPW